MRATACRSMYSRHVQAHQVLLVAEQLGGERLDQLGLAHAGRAEEQERTQRPVAVGQSGARAADRARHLRHGLVLPHHARGQPRLQVAQLARPRPRPGAAPGCRSTAPPARRCRPRRPPPSAAGRRPGPPSVPRARGRLAPRQPATARRTSARWRAPGRRAARPSPSRASCVFLLLLQRADARRSPSSPAPSARAAGRQVVAAARRAGGRSASRRATAVVGLLRQRQPLHLELVEVPLQVVHLARAPSRSPCAAGSRPRPSGRWPCPAACGRRCSAATASPPPRSRRR